MNGAEMSSRDFWVSSPVRTHAQMRAALEFPRVRVPYSARFELPVTTPLRTPTHTQYRRRYPSAFGRRQPRAGTPSPYAVDADPHAVHLLTRWPWNNAHHHNRHCHNSQRTVSYYRLRATTNPHACADAVILTDSTHTSAPATSPAPRPSDRRSVEIDGDHRSEAQLSPAICYCGSEGFIQRPHSRTTTRNETCNIHKRQQNPADYLPLHRRAPYPVVEIAPEIGAIHFAIPKTAYLHSIHSMQRPQFSSVVRWKMEIPVSFNNHQRFQLRSVGRRTQMLTYVLRHSIATWNVSAKEHSKVLVVAFVTAIAASSISPSSMSQERSPRNLANIGSNPFHYSPNEGTKLTARPDVSVYPRAPSKFLGNLFNGEIRRLNEGETYRVKEVLIYPGFGGNQIWLKLAPEKTGGCTPKLSECWALYGLQPKTDDSLAIWNFDQETTVGQETTEE